MATPVEQESHFYLAHSSKESSQATERWQVTVEEEWNIFMYYKMVEQEHTTSQSGIRSRTGSTSGVVNQW